MLTAMVRVDASSSIGTGHVMRCLTLAEGLRARGAIVAFICRRQAGDLIDHIEARGFRVVPLAVADSSHPGELRAAAEARGRENWLVDVAATQGAVAALGGKPQWLIVDSYECDVRWERAMRPSVERIMVIDDLADRAHDCDVLLDQNEVENRADRYADKVTHACTLLLGPEYALLPPLYAELHERLPPREGPIERLFLFVGGSDVTDLTGRALSAFLACDRDDIELDVVVSPAGPHVDAVRRLAAPHANVHVHSRLPTLAPLMASADFAIGACGATTWERLCLGLPSLVVTLADNQDPIAETLHARHLVQWLGPSERVDQAAITSALSSRLRDDLEGAWSIRCSALVDGRGLERVCSVLTLTRDASVRVRHARAADEALLLEWANDPEVRANAFSTGQILPEVHRRWFRHRLRDVDGCRFYIVESSEGVPIGQVRFDRTSDGWVVSYSLARQYRGRGLGRVVLNAALDALRANHPGEPVIGHVKPANLGSRRVFESLRFRLAEDETRGHVTYGATL